MLPPPMIRDWARRLIACEMDADPSSHQIQSATVRVYENLRRQLCAPVGADGFQALACRALALAKSQSPGLRAVQVTANGGLRGLGELGLQVETGEDGEIGIILIGQLLALFLTLLGEAATLRLIEGVPPQIGAERKSDPTAAGNSAAEPSYFGPYENILAEADQLRNVSDRLEALVESNAGIDELSSVAGNIRNIATVLDVFTLLRSKAGGSQVDTTPPPPSGYVN